MYQAGWLILASILFNSAAVVAGESSPADSVESNVATSVDRVRSGLLVLYDFTEPDGEIVKDRSGVGRPIQLRIANVEAVRRVEGSLDVQRKTTIRSEGPASKVMGTIRRTGEMSIEAWLQPAGTDQSGPARIVTLSGGASQRNFTLGQDGHRFDVRLRTSKTSGNGIPSLGSAADSLSADLTHVVYTRARGGMARIYVNGQQSSERKISGNLSNWDSSFRLALANELDGSRPWIGTLSLVAIYGRRLSPEEVQQNYRAGSSASTLPAQVVQQDPRARQFETQVAPLFAKHCLECHDAPTKEGGLDLSHRQSALAGGDSGAVIVPGKAAKSLLWESIDTDEMPSDRSPLSPDEKAIVKDWIDAGASWSLAMIDPAVYAHEGLEQSQWIRRLTVVEYIATVRGAVGVDVAQEAREILPPDLRADGFSNTAYNLNVDLGHVDAYSQLAELIVSRMDVAKFAARFSKRRNLNDNDMRDLITKMGKWLLRGPLNDREIITFRGVSTTVASAGGGFDDAVGFIIEAMLQSPRFLYQIENQRGDGTQWPVSQYELASRLSYILWGGPPDERLMNAADNGELDHQGIEQQVTRMLEDPRAVDRSAHFIDEWLNLGRLANLRPNPKRFPNWTPELATAMREETLAYFKEVVWRQKRPLADLLNTQVTFATLQLAKHYGFDTDAAEPSGTDGMSRYDLQSLSGRGGLLTQGSVLTVGGDEASMVARGLFVLHDLLRGVVKDPPPSVDATPVPTEAGLTHRSIAESRIDNTNCGGCHAKFEPLAFGLERFDGLGVYREKDEFGNELREDGEVLFPGEAQPVAYNTSAELMDLLASSPRVRQCLTWKVTQFAVGRPLVAADATLLEDIHQDAQQGGGTYASLMRAIVMSDLVQTTRTEAETNE